MKAAFKLIICLLVGIFLVSLIGCASSGRKHTEKLNVPPGLDSTTVVKSLEVAKTSFVSTQREKKADQLADTGKKELDKVDEFWAYLEQNVKKSSSLTDAEKQLYDREFNLGAQYLERFKKLSENGTNEKKAQQALRHCQEAQQHLEKAITINPFDKKARTLLAVTYYNLQHMFGLEKNYKKSIAILERLTRIEKGEHELFRLLGESYLAQKNYEKALLNFQKAQTVMLKTSFEAPPDTSMLFYYMYAQGDAYTRMYDAARAVKAFQIADRFARSPQEKADLKNYMKWINWDGGNIRASELWDKILTLEDTKDYEKMAKACEQLLTILKTKKAQMSVFHKLAVVEFEILDRKAQAVEKIWQAYNILTSGELNIKDEEIQPVLNSYGAMLYRLGIEAREKQEKKFALAYFTKAASFEWDQAAKAYIELVTLLWNDPEKAIFYGKKALANNSGLSPEETNELLSLMVRAHKSAGLYDEARAYFKKWKQSE
jgi:tetratricopeptide (TPR) repeat protein